MTILNASVNVLEHFFQKSLLIKEYGILVLACPCKLWEFTRIVKANNLGTSKASKDLSASRTT